MKAAAAIESNHLHRAAVGGQRRPRDVADVALHSTRLHALNSSQPVLTRSEFAERSDCFALVNLVTVSTRSSVSN